MTDMTHDDLSDLSPRHLTVYLAGVRGGDGEGDPPAAGVPEGGDPPPAPAAPPAEPPNWEARVQEWGGEEAIQDAMKVAAALQDPDGLAAMFVEAGRSLGVPFDRLSGLFDDETPPPPGEQPDPDAPVTAAQLQAAVTQLQAGIEQQNAAGQQAAAKVVIDAELQRLGLDPKEIPQVLEMGSRHLADGDYDPEHIRAAIAKGHEDWTATVQSVAAKYVQAKVEQAAGQPNPLTGGGSPSGSEEPTEAANVEEAKARVRARLSREGVL